MRRPLFSFVVFLSMIACMNSDAEPLQVPKDEKLRNFIAHTWVIAERKAEPYWVKILVREEPGECGDVLENCPRAEAFVVVGNWGEYPDIGVYQLPEAYGWRFERWVKWPAVEAEDELVKLVLSRMEMKVEDEHLVRHWTDYQVEANPWRGAINKLSELGGPPLSSSGRGRVSRE
jgi:hypothetical protein